MRKRASFKKVMSAWIDKIPGGLADDHSPEDFDEEQLDLGKEVEAEHTDDTDMATEIAMDHLMEIDDYYTRLNEMEAEAEAEKKTEIEYDRLYRDDDVENDVDDFRNNNYYFDENEEFDDEESDDDDNTKEVIEDDDEIRNWWL